jgi:EAL domain-containing protein (putative c-di-GMP-specific phosphodiesterase class I)
MISPADFIPLFEGYGLISLVDSYVWEEAARQVAEWRDRYGIVLPVSVNLSRSDTFDQDLEEYFVSLVERHGLDPTDLKPEVTESAYSDNTSQIIDVIGDLRRHGFQVEMDDFGSGYSSLNMLKDMPVDLLKIDMMFLYKTKDTRKAQLILQNIINLSGDLGIPSLTEGVETRDQRDMLLSMGCKMFQGYYFAKPMPLEDFEAFYGSAA